MAVELAVPHSLRLCKFPDPRQSPLQLRNFLQELCLQNPCNQRDDLLPTSRVACHLDSSMGPLGPPNSLARPASPVGSRNVNDLRDASEPQKITILSAVLKVAV